MEITFLYDYCLQTSHGNHLLDPHSSPQRYLWDSPDGSLGRSGVRLPYPRVCLLFLFYFYDSGVEWGT